MKTIIIGIGDNYYGDDAIGLVLVRKLKKTLSGNKNITFIECEKRSFEIMDYLKSDTKILIIDAVKMGLPPGEFKIFKFSKIKPYINKKIISFHQLGVAENILLAESLGKNINNIYIFGIEPALLKPCNSLSTVLKNNLSKYIQGITTYLNKDNVETDLQVC